MVVLPAEGLVRSSVAAFVALLILTLSAAAETRDDAPPAFRLLMFEQPGCGYCRIFNRDIAPIYAVSPEGRTVPLIHVQLRDPLPAGVTLDSRPFATPTFVLVGPDGAEAGRIVGYLGEDFFWPYLGRMFDRAGVILPPQGQD